MKKKKEKPKLPVPMPQLPCQECIEKGEIIEDMLVKCYCEHNEVGGVYLIPLGRWRINTHLSKDEFDQLVNGFIKGLRPGEKNPEKEAKYWN